MASCLMSGEFIAGEDDDDQVEQEPPPPPPPVIEISDVIKSAFVEHSQHLREARRKRRQSLQVQTVVGDTAGSSSTAIVPGGQQSNEHVEFGEVLTSDSYDGDSVMRTLQKLLSMVDDRGFARSPQQVQFHDAFIRACSRVMYRDDWSMNKPAIMKHNAWQDCPSQILVSTPRRFGKTFS